MNDAANNRNMYDLNMYNAETGRGTARSQDYYKGQDSQREWWKTPKYGVGMG
jgi:hypothetical protein